MRKADLSIEDKAIGRKGMEGVVDDGGVREEPLLHANVEDYSGRHLGLNKRQNR